MNFWKTLTIMKISAFLLIVSFFQATAGISYSQETKLHLNLEQVTIKQVFEVIEEQSEFIIFYSDKVIDTESIVSIRLSNSNIVTVLDSLSKQVPVSYRIIDRQIVIIPVEKENQEASIQTSKHIVSGLVTDAKENISLPGVNISVKGTCNIYSDSSINIDGAGGVNINSGIASKKSANISKVAEDAQPKTEVIDLGPKETEEYDSDKAVGKKCDDVTKPDGGYGSINE